MTNKEKFEEIFGYSPKKANCLFPLSVCDDIHKQGLGCTTRPQRCPFYDWWDKEYKPCFKLREDLK